MARTANQQYVTLSATASTQLSSGNLSRSRFELQNRSGGSVYFSFGAAVAINGNGSYTGIEIAAFSSYSMEQNCTTDAIHARGDNVLTGNAIVFTEVNV